MKGSQSASALLVDRRRFVLGAGAGACGGAALGARPGSLLHVQESAAPAENAGVYRFRIGEIRATVISDGQIAFPAWPTYAPDVPEATVTKAMARRGLTPPTYLLDANALLVETGDRRILIDAGWGAFAPSVGVLVARLASIGVAADDIDTVVLSHIHPDHVGGLRDADGAPRFGAADLVVSAPELTQWREGPDFGAMSISDDFKPVFVGAAQSVLDWPGRLHALDADGEIAPGVSLTPLHGHTAGHCGVRIASGDDELLYVADSFHDQAFDLDHPDWRTAFDFDPSAAAATRQSLLDRAAADGALLLAFHMPFPGLGVVARRAAGYDWRPARWALNPEPA